MPPRRSDSLRTQARIMATAEQLFAERGLDGVSLSEINRLAGQRNKSALHYHFGSRDGLLRAILDRHRTRIDGRRAEILAESPSPDRLTLHDAVRLMVLPLSELVSDRTDGGVHYLRIMAQLSAAPKNPLNAWMFNEPRPAFAVIAPTLYRSIPRSPTMLRMRRAELMNGTMFHALLLQTYAEERGDTTPEEHELYVNDLIDCISGLLSAPISPRSASAIAVHEEAGRVSRAADDEIPVFYDD